MYTESELKEKSFQDIKDIAESLGIEYTTKVKTIEVILSKQSQDETPKAPEETPTSQEEIPKIEIPEVKPNPKPEPKVEVIKPKGKQRYRIDGTPIHA